jgi:hypothetical protein
MALNRYSNQAAYDAATKSVTESTVSLVGDGTGIKVDGVNVITESPERGDILFLDANKNIKYLKCDTYKSAAMPSGCTLVGVVGWREGGEVLIINKTGGSGKWCPIYVYDVTGYTLDGADHTVTFSMTGEGSHTFTYNATTLASLASQLNTWLGTASNFTSVYMTTGGWMARVDSDGVLRIYCMVCGYWQQQGLGCTGMSIAGHVGDEIEALSSILMTNGSMSGYCTCNVAKTIEYYGANGRTPTSTEYNSSNNPPVNSQSYLSSDYCSGLRAVYQTYEDYIRSRVAVCPYTRGAMTLNQGKVYTLAMKDVTYLDASGTAQIKYPCHNWAGNVAYSHDLLGAGKWWLPDLETMYRLIRDVTYGISGVTAAKSDPVNRSLNAIGGSLMGCSSGWWTSSRCNAGSAWFIGGGGVTYPNNTFNGNSARAVLLLKL